MKSIWFHAALGVCGLGGVSGVAIGQSTFTPIGDAPGGEFVSECRGVSNDGLAVVGFSEVASGETVGVVWSAGILAPFGDLTGGARNAMALAIADNGVIVGDGSGFNGREGFKYHTGRFRALGGTQPGGAIGSSALAVSPGGEFAVGYHEIAGPDSEACYWVGPTIFPLGFLMPGAGHSFATGVSADASIIVGGSENGLGSHEAFRWTLAGGMEGLGFLPDGNFSEANAISDDGLVIVGAATPSGGSGASHAMRWNAEGGMEDLGVLPGTHLDYSSALAASADGSIIVGQAMGDEAIEAFIWDGANGMRSLRSLLIGLGVQGLADWHLSAAYGVSNDGTVIGGTGTNPAGDTEGWVVVLAGPVCPADFNGDLSVDFFDYDDFVACFEGRACPPGATADFNHDLSVDFFDYDDFVLAFEGGC